MEALVLASHMMKAQSLNDRNHPRPIPESHSLRSSGVFSFVAAIAGTGLFALALDLIGG